MHLKTKSPQAKGFTLVEIMIVVAIIGLLAAIAIPNFVRSRKTAQKNSCINNLRIIDGACQELQLERPTESVTIPHVQPYFGRVVGGTLPTCPSGGTYGVSAGSPPTCTIQWAGFEHVLPF